MRIHSNTLTRSDIVSALRQPEIAPDIELVTFGVFSSRKRQRAYEVQLGTDDKTSGPTKSRHYKNSGTHGAGQIWAATYDEWGFFLADLFRLDPNAIAGQYNGADDFHAQTKGAYEGSTV